MHTDSRRRPPLLVALAAPILLVAGLLASPTAHAVPVSDITRIVGLHENVVQGLGIVVGLNGTGDDAEASLAVARPYREFLRNLGNPLESTSEIGESGAFAVVLVTMRMPETGGSEGERFDVSVDTLFDASSLEGGRLVSSLLRPPDQDSPELPVIAVAEGRVQLDGEDATSAFVPNGGMMVMDLRPTVMSAAGIITLYLHPSRAHHRNALAVADAINEPDGFGFDGPPIARVDESGAVIRVQVPLVDRSNPARFIDSIRSIDIDDSLLHQPAIVVVDRRAGTIVASSTVTVNPLALASNDFGIQFAPADPAAPDAGPGGPWTAVGSVTPGSREGTRLDQLLQAMNRMRVPVGTQIDLIYSFRDAGAMTARIVDKG